MTFHEHLIGWILGFVIIFVFLVGRATTLYEVTVLWYPVVVFPCRYGCISQTPSHQTQTTYTFLYHAWLFAA